MANCEKNNIRNTIFTTAKVARPKDIAPALSSSGVPSNSGGRKSSKVEKINSLRSYLSSMISPQRSVSPIHGSKLPIIAGISATLYPIIVLATKGIVINIGDLIDKR